jgi:hypothetical protein
MRPSRRFEPYQTDMPLRRLHTAEAFVVTTVRLWNAGDPDPEFDEPRWRMAFRHARVDLRGTLAFDQFCRMLAIAASRSIQVRSVGCCAVSHDEAVLLQALGYIQIGRPTCAEATLLQLCPLLAARLVLPPAQTLVTALGARRLWMPQRPRMSPAPPAGANVTPPTLPARLH